CTAVERRSGLGARRGTSLLELGSAERNTGPGLAVGLHRPRNGLQLDDVHELTLANRRLLTRRRHLDHLAAGLVQHEDLGLPHRPPGVLLVALPAVLVRLRLRVPRRREL